LVPLVLTAIFRGDYSGALVWLVIAGISDGLDGFLARRLRVSSRTGAYLDPIADKCLLSGVYFALGYNRVIPWWLTAVVLGRDVLMLIFIAAAFLFTSVRDFPPTVWGKLSTAIQIVTAIAVLIEGAFHFEPWQRAFKNMLIGATVVATIWSAIDYLWIGIGIFRRTRVARA
jgi:cardiolipin synthase